MTSDHGVKMLALSRSSLIVGGLFGGGYGGYALSFVPISTPPLGSARVWHAGAAAVAGVLLVVAALLLERACHIPGGDDEDPEPNGAARPSASYGLLVDVADHEEHRAEDRDQVGDQAPGSSSASTAMLLKDAVRSLSRHGVFSPRETR